MNKEFVDNLTNFSSALESIVDALNEQVKKNNNTDAILDVLSEIDGNKIKSIAKNLKEVNDRTKVIESRTEEIVELVKSSKEKEGADAFSKVGNKNTKKKITDGVSMIVLIAGAVMLIGLAFKLIGNVDFASVIGLSMAMSMLAYSFKSIAEIKGLSVSSVTASALMMIAMTGAIVISSHLIGSMASISLTKLVLFGLLGITISYTFSIVANSISKLKLNAKTITTLLLLPVILPLMTLGIVLSSYIINEFFVPMSAKTAVGFVVTSFAIGLAMIAFLPTIYIMSKFKVSIKGVIASTMAIPLMALGISLSAFIFSEANKLSPGLFKSEVPGFMWSLQVGLSLIAILPTFLILAKNLSMSNIVGMGLALVAIPMIALAIAICATIFSNIGDYGKYPGLGWAIGVGASIGIFAVEMLALGTLITLSGGLALTFLASALLGIPLIINGLILADTLLSSHNWSGSNYPSKDWAEGVGGAIYMFAKAYGIITMLQGFNKLLSFFGTSGQSFEEFILGKGTGENRDGSGIVDILIAVGKIFSKNANVFTGGYPSKDWAEGVGESIYMFAKAYAIITGLEGFSSLMSIFGSSGKSMEEFILGKGTGEERDGSGIIDILIIAGKRFNKAGDVFGGGYPSKEWADGVGGAVANFAEAFSKITSSNALDSVISFFTGSKKTPFKDFMLGGEGETNGGIVGIIIEVARRFNANPDVFKNSVDISKVNYGKVIKDFMDNIPDEDKIDDFKNFFDVFDNMLNAIRNIDRLAISLDRLGDSFKKIKDNQIQSITDNNSSLFGDVKNTQTINNNINSTGSTKATDTNKIVNSSDSATETTVQIISKFAKNMDTNLQEILEMQKDKERIENGDDEPVIGEESTENVNS